MLVDSFEARLVLCLAVFGVVWQLLIVPFLPFLWVGLNPVLQYLIFNLGFVFLFVAIVGVGFSLLTTHEVDLWCMVRGGIGAFIVFSFALDLWQPPFAYGSCGQLLIPSELSLVGASVDRMVGFVFESLFGSFGNFSLFEMCFSLKYVFIYVLVPILAFLVAAFLFTPKKFVDFVFGRFG